MRINICFTPVGIPKQHISGLLLRGLQRSTGRAVRNLLVIKVQCHFKAIE